MKNIIVVLTMVLLIAAIPVAAVTVTRDLPDAATVNQEINVTLNIDINDNTTTSFGIDESVPNGWIFIGSDTFLVNNISTGDIINDNITWIFTNLTNLFPSVYNRSITYTVKPTNTGTYSFSGAWITVSPDVEESVQGDSTLVVNSEVTETSTPIGSSGGGSGGWIPVREIINNTSDKNVSDIVQRPNEIQQSIVVNETIRENLSNNIQSPIVATEPIEETNPTITVLLVIFVTVLIVVLVFRYALK